MSSDQQVLEAIAMKTRQEMRYFELVKATCGDAVFTCYACLGKHAVFFLGPDLNKIHEGWELFYAYILKVIQDKNSLDMVMLVMSGQKSPKWMSERLFIRCENRDLLLKHLRCSWQTDHMWRVARVGLFPLSRHELTQESCDPPMKPFINYKWVKYNHYCLMLPCTFECQPNSVQAGNTGEYVNESGISLFLHVHEALTLDHLVQLKRDHIRWVAEEYKLQLVRDEKQFYVLRNQQRQKRMNLAGDMAAWYSWEIIIMTPSATLICLLFRRQFIPPVCNSAQDIAVLMRCPVDNKGNLPKDLLIEAHLIGDSIVPDASTVIPYRKIVQAKLDGLRFDDESFDWIRSHLKLNTRWHRYAKAFLKSLLRLFIEGNPKQFGEDLLRSPALAAEDASDRDEGEPPEELERILVELDSFHNDLLQEDDRMEKLKVKNRWLKRVARYFSWAVDGGLLQSRFTLDIMVEHITQLPDAANKKALKALRFMLHTRPLDMTKPYDESPLVTHLTGTNLKEWTFNDRVIRAILTQDYLRKRLGRTNDADYIECLANLLNSNAGTHVKAYICRIFMERVDQRKTPQDESVHLAVVPSLLQILEFGGPFLATYASAALVNLSEGNTAVKMKLFSHNVAGQACKNVKTKDDELICYTLMLLVNLTKQPHHRNVIADTGFLPLLYDLLTSSYHLCKSSVGLGGVSSSSVAGGVMKVRLLTQVCILIGHFSIEDTYRQFFLDQETFGHTVKCLLWMFDESDPGSSLMCKVMFALKQLCKDRGDQKQNVGAHIIGRLIERLGGKSLGKDFERTSEFIFQSILLLQMLATHITNCQIMDRPKDYWEKDKTFEDYMDELLELPQTQQIQNFEDKIRQLKECVQIAMFKNLAIA